MQVRYGVAVVAIAAVVLGFRQWQQQQSADPSVYHSNGRIEARQSHIATRLGGLLATTAVKEGDHVTAGQTMALLDSRPAKAELARAEAGIAQAKDQLALTQAQLAQSQSECAYAHSQYSRVRVLGSKKTVSADELDGARTRANSCDSVIHASQAAVNAAASGLKMAEAMRDRITVDLDDMTITAPFSGYVLYRLAETGEVIPPGGRLFTLVSDEDVYLTVFLPTEVTGKLAMGQATQLRLDAQPDKPVPATVTFIAPEAQFTPKTVETASERSKLMFRAKLNVDPAFLKQNAWVKSGMPGVALLHTAPDAKL